MDKILFQQLTELSQLVEKYKALEPDSCRVYPTAIAIANQVSEVINEVINAIGEQSE